MRISYILNRLHHFVATLRLPMYRIRHNTFGKDNFITEHVLLHGCHFGNYNYVGNYSILNNVIVGNYNSIAPHCIIGGEEHAYWDYSMSDRLSKLNINSRKTTIGHDVWIGAGSFIRQGVTIGNGAVVGAHSVVLKDVPPYTIVVGSPANIIKKRFPENMINILQNDNYYNMSQVEAKKYLQDFQCKYPIQSHEGR